MSKIKSQKDFWSGAMFCTIGVAFAYGATTYNVGQGARMGPGYFPLLVGIVTAILGIATMVKATLSGGKDGDPIGAVAWRPLFFIIAANLAFGVLLGGLPGIGLPPMGMVVGIYVLTFVASLAGDEFDFKSVALLATILAAGSYVAFVWALKLQFPVWPLLITG